MRPLVAVRRAAPFEPDFVRRSPLFWPVARAANAIRGQGDFPPVDALAGVFEGPPAVRFVPASPRRRGGPLDPSTLYDARITLEGVVPTRSRCWHDLMNALVWGTFPRSKRALHARQHRAISARIGPGAERLPPTRTRELDTLALLDEGGVVILAGEPDALRSALHARGGGPARRLEARIGDVLVFGHAIYESLVLGVSPAVVAAVVLPRPPAPSDVVRAADDGLARIVEDEGAFRRPSELVRVDLDGLCDSPARGAAVARDGESRRSPSGSLVCV